MKIISLVVLFIFLILFSAQEALACSCMPRPESEAFGKADIVFLGRVSEINDGQVSFMRSPSRLEVKFEVVRAWKSIESDAITVYTLNADGIGCGTQFKEDETWLVYARKNGRDNLLYTSICDNTVLISSEQDLPKDLLSRQVVTITKRTFYKNRNMRVASVTAISLLMFLGIGLLWGIVRKRAA